MKAYDKVSIKLFKDDKQYKDDVFVGLNGRTYLIQRGQVCTVPYCVKRLLEDSEYMEQSAKQKIQALQGAYKKRTQA